MTIKNLQKELFEIELKLKENKEELKENKEELKENKEEREKKRQWLIKQIKKIQANTRNTKGSR